MRVNLRSRLQREKPRIVSAPSNDQYTAGFCTGMMYPAQAPLPPFRRSFELDAECVLAILRSLISCSGQKRQYYLKAIQLEHGLGTIESRTSHGRAETREPDKQFNGGSDGHRMLGLSQSGRGEPACWPFSSPTDNSPSRFSFPSLCSKATHIANLLSR